MERFFISDLHLGHDNILFSRNMFHNIEEHDEYIIDKWNSKVTNKDEVYILGDLSFRSKKHITYYLCRMKGKKHLIVGNHDSSWMKSVNDLGKYFASVEKLKTIKFDKKQISLCHYPMLEWPGSRYVDSGSSYLIHGHIHNSRDTIYEYIKQHQPHALNAGVDINNFEPVTFEELKNNCNLWYERNESDFNRDKMNLTNYFMEGAD